MSTCHTFCDGVFFVLASCMRICLFLVMSHLCLCALEFDMPCSWRRNYDDAKGHNFSINANSGSDLFRFGVNADEAKDMVHMFFEHGLFYVDMFRKGSTLVEVSQQCPCEPEMSTGYVFNAPLSSSVGCLSFVTPIGESVAPPRFSQVNSEKPEVFCEYCVDKTFFSAKMRLCEYNAGGFFFVRVKCVYEDRNNIVVSWGEEMPGGRIKGDGFGDCKFSFNTCSHQLSPNGAKPKKASPKIRRKGRHR